MSDIRKRTGSKGTTYQVRYPSKATKSGYAYKTFNTLKEARAFREDAHAKKSLGFKCSDVDTVSKAVNKWLDICEKEGLNGREPVTSYTLKNYSYRAEIIKDYDWTKGLNELTPPDVVEFRSWLLRNNMSRDLARKVLASFQSIIKEMTLRGHLISNVAMGINIRNESRYDEPMQIPSKNEIVLLLRAADRLSQSSNKLTAKTWKRYRPILYLAVDSGMRPQEYLAISKKSILENGIQVDRAIDGGGGYISVTKTYAGRRFIELSQNTLNLIKIYVEDHSVKNDDDLVFSTSNGKWLCRKNWQRRGFNIACIEAGLVKKVIVNGEEKIKPKYRPYDLRHFYASMLFEKKINMKKIQVLMGHTNIETTLNVYGHLLDDGSDDQSMKKGMLGGMLLNECGKSVATTL